MVLLTPVLIHEAKISHVVQTGTVFVSYQAAAVPYTSPVGCGVHTSARVACSKALVTTITNPGQDIVVASPRTVDIMARWIMVASYNPSVAAEGQGVH
jgi:hypothetical protein